MAAVTGAVPTPELPVTTQLATLALQVSRGPGGFPEDPADFQIQRNPIIPYSEGRRCGLGGASPSRTRSANRARARAHSSGHSCPCCSRCPRCLWGPPRVPPCEQAERTSLRQPVRCGSAPESRPTLAPPHRSRPQKPHLLLPRLPAVGTRLYVPHVPYVPCSPARSVHACALGTHGGRLEPLPLRRGSASPAWLLRGRDPLPRPSRSPPPRLTHSVLPDPLWSLLPDPAWPS